MQLRAEVKCYHCGRSSGTWLWGAGTGPAWGVFTAAGGAGRVPLALARLRCQHCGGPVFLDDVDEARPPRALVLDRPRPGRPRKRPSAA